MSVTLPTVEAEYHAISSTSREVVWYRRLLTDLGIPVTTPTLLYGDN